MNETLVKRVKKARRVFVFTQAFANDGNYIEVTKKEALYRIEFASIEIDYHAQIIKTGRKFETTQEQRYDLFVG